MPPSDDALRTGQVLRSLMPAMRAAAPVTLCLAAGQLAGRTDLGLIMAVGARRVAMVDPHGQPASRGANLALATVVDAAAVFFGTLAGNSLPLSALGMFALGWVAGVGRSHGEAAGRLTAAPAVLFALAQLLPGDTSTAGQRALLVAVAGGVAILFILGGLPRGWLQRAVARARTAFALLLAAASSPAAGSRFGLLLAGTVTGCLLAVRALGLPQGNWVVVSALLVLRPEAAGTRRGAVQRLEGTLAGCLLAGALLVLLHSVVLSDLVIFLLLVCYFRVPQGSPWALAFLTPALVLGVGLLQPGHWQWAVSRAVDVVAGTLVALAVGLLLGARESPSPL